MRDEKCDTEDESLVYFGTGYKCFSKEDVDSTVWPRAVKADAVKTKSPLKVQSFRTAEPLCATTTGPAFEAYSAAYKGPSDVNIPGDHFSLGLLNTAIDEVDGLRDNYTANMA